MTDPAHFMAAPARIERQAQSRPDAVAVCCGNDTITYAELLRRVSRLASRLRALGVSDEDLVGVVLDPSIDLVVALLAVLHAGAAYLPLTAGQPQERLQFMLDDARPVALLSTRNCIGRLPPQQLPCLWLDEPDASAGTGCPPSQPAKDALAYVIYTSGSTGRPKGCQVTHHNLVRLFTATQAQFGFGPESVWTLFHSYGFDFSVWELFGALLHGGRLVVVPREIARSAADFHNLLVREQVTVLNQTPSAFEALVDFDQQCGLPPTALALQQVIFGGEALELHLIKPWLERHGDQKPQLINGYGITETTVFVTFHRVLSTELGGGHSSLIGRPMADLTVYLLDEHLREVADGEVGEIFVGGEGVCRGYLNRPELNQARFVDWRAGPTHPTQRLYKSGDLARRHPEGELEYLGRSDQQVKIRGHRIETGEIEHRLALHPGVRAAAVIARPGAAGSLQLVAYIVPSLQRASVESLRQHLAQTLPTYMVPAAFVDIERLPTNDNGKLDVQALPPPATQRPELAQAHEAPAGALEATVCAAFGHVLALEGVGALDNFFELGGDSLRVQLVLAELSPVGAGARHAVTFFQDPTPRALANAIAASPATPGETPASPPDPAAPGRPAEDNAIAIIAMAGRFPGAQDVEAFWQNLRDGVESITHFGDTLDASVPADLRADPHYVAARGVIDGIEAFDASFFGIPPAEATLMDPQQRVFLELCWECLERAGHAPSDCDVPVGVFAGCYNNSYFSQHVQAHPDLVAQTGAFQVMLGNEKDFVATRVAHRLNLTGPALSINTACSTSLVAIAEAFFSLREGRCDMALAGGVAVTCPPRSGYLHQAGSMLSPDGHTRAFDAHAQGTVFSDGAGVVLLKRLPDALADGNPILAVIRGAALNNDGGAKASFTAPTVDGQAAVVAQALRCAGVDARSLSYVEAHGTATPMGDPVEVAALTQAFAHSTTDHGFCRLGSVKGNIGHVVTAAGAAGVIKTVLALQAEELPGTLHYVAPNPALDLANTPFVVQAQRSPWPRTASPRRAGVSSFGVGGTNAHVILEEAPLQPPGDPVGGSQLIVLSARNKAALEASGLQLATYLEAHSQLVLADVAHTLRVGRVAFAERLAVVADTPAAAALALRATAGPGRVCRHTLASSPPTVWLFPGQGAQYLGMGRQLYAQLPTFRRAFDDCQQALASHVDLLALMASNSADNLRRTANTQPALFAIEYALAQAWLALGLRPAAMIGHSVGEFVAAVLAGVMRLPDALRLVALRGQLMQDQPTGAMLSVRLGATALQPQLPPGLVLAADNAPQACVVAGPSDALVAWQVQLEAQGVATRLLQTSHAFHSPMMDAALPPFRKAMAAVPLSPPALPIISTRTGRRLLDSEATDPEHWCQHLRDTVQFSASVQAAQASFGSAVFLEVGPRDMLGSLVRQHRRADMPAPVAVSSLAEQPDTELAAWQLAVAQLWSMGLPLALETLDERPQRRRVRLPTYPFQRKRHWVDAAAAMSAASGPAPVAAVPSPLPETSPLPSPQPLTADLTMPDPLLQPMTALSDQVRTVLDEVAGLEVSNDELDVALVELGLDSLSLTQVALQLSKRMGVDISFRQLMQSLNTVNALSEHLARHGAQARTSPATTTAGPAAAPKAAAGPAQASLQSPAGQPVVASSASPLLQQVIEQQMQLMAQQLALLAGQSGQAVRTTQTIGTSPPQPQGAIPVAPATATPTAPAAQATAAAPSEAVPLLQRYDVKTAFGAIARIHTAPSDALTPRQSLRLDAFVRRYVARTAKSKAYTTEHRPHLADPRVVNGFRPLTKEITYQIVVERSKGSRLWDLDGHEYVDALNGFGMNLFGWSPEFVQQAVRQQVDLGYEIGPQHPLAGQVARRMCELTGADRAALCNTGSEAVMGTLRIARTLTGRRLVVIFAGSYHGIFDEVLVRGTKTLRSVPAAPGILPSTAENVIVLDYANPQALEVIRQQGGEIAAVLVEPVQTRRPDLQPKAFLQDLRTVTREIGALLIFDEVVTGFRVHPRGAQGLFGVEADLAAYGKVVGGGFPIGIIAGKKACMDVLDGGPWAFGDDSFPSVGVTYFAGTFVRHPLALAAADAVLQHLAVQGPKLQSELNQRTQGLAQAINDYCRDVGAPVEVRYFGSFWKTFFSEEHPLQDLLFAMMRSRGVHILDNFPCFMTTAHSAEDIAQIVQAFCDSVRELQESDFLPRRTSEKAFDASKPPVPGARLGKEPNGRPAWFVPHPEDPKRYLKVSA